jgi:hypothetical protein
MALARSAVLASRRYLGWIAVVVAVGLLLSDYPFGWSFWFEHPFFASFLAALVLLVLTLSVVEAVIRRREERRCCLL